MKPSAVAALFHASASLQTLAKLEPAKKYAGHKETLATWVPDGAK